LHFFAFPENSTLFFSIASALFVKNTRGGGTAASPLATRRKEWKGTAKQVGEDPFGFAQGKISLSAKFWCGRQELNLHGLSATRS
jgi:hypothetical protein